MKFKIWSIERDQALRIVLIGCAIELVLEKKNMNIFKIWFSERDQVGQTECFFFLFIELSLGSSILEARNKRKEGL